MDEVGGLLRTHPGIGLPMIGKTSALAISAGKTSVLELLVLVLNELTLSELALREQKLNARNRRDQRSLRRRV